MRSKISVRPAAAALVLAGTALAGLSGGSALAGRESVIAAPAMEAPAAAAVSRAGAHGSLADMVEAVSPSVVQIETEREGGIVRTPFGLLRGQPQRGSGSGFIVDSDGTVITNNHVVDGSRVVTVTFADGTERTARVLGTDEKTDVAVLRIEGGGKFVPVSWGDSDRMRVGDSVFAVGSPFGLGNSVTAGIVSARGREIGAGPYDDFLQVDAAINSGNSGGPLFDASGRVIGVNTAIFSPTGGNVGIGFAIPARMAQRVAQDIVENGSVSRGWVGVGIQDLTPEVATALRVRDAKGALISQIQTGSPADSSGLASGDIVRSFGGKAVEDGRDLARFVAEATIGSRVPVVVIRDGREVALNLQIAAGRG